MVGGQGFERSAVAGAQGVLRPRPVSGDLARHRQRVPRSLCLPRPHHRRMGAQLCRRAVPAGGGDGSEFAAEISRRRAQDAGAEAHHRRARIPRSHPRHKARRAGGARQGAGDEPARRLGRLGFSQAARRILGPVQCRGAPRRPCPHPSAARLDRDRHLALHRAREYAGGAAVFRARGQALPLAGRKGYHHAGGVDRGERCRDHPRARNLARAGARRPRYGPRERGRLRAVALARVHVVAEAPLKLVVVGHVDHGKSTLIGRLLHEAGVLPRGKVEELERVSARRRAPLEWSFVLDSLQAERDQAVTIDTTRFWLKLGGRDLVIIDAPGHREFLANMVSGAAGADAAVLVIDAAEGLQDQTRRHAYLLRLLGFQQIVVAVNKIDMVGYAEARFRALETEACAFLGELGVAPRYVLPLSARHGDNLAAASARLPWWPGPTLVEGLVGFTAAVPAEAAPLRLSIQDVYRQEDQRILVGRIESGRLAVGDTLLFSPSNKLARVRSIEAWPGPAPRQVVAGSSVGITLDRPLFIERGEVASHVEHAPLLANGFRASLFW